MAQKGGNLALVKADAEAIHRRFGSAVAEHLDQVLDTNTLHQVSWLCLKEWPACTQRGQAHIQHLTNVSGLFKKQIQIHHSRNAFQVNKATE